MALSELRKALQGSTEKPQRLSALRAALTPKPAEDVLENFREQERGTRTFETPAAPPKRASLADYAAPVATASGAIGAPIAPPVAPTTTAAPNPLANFRAQERATPALPASIPPTSLAQVNPYNASPLSGNRPATVEQGKAMLRASQEKDKVAAVERQKQAVVQQDARAKKVAEMPKSVTFPQTIYDQRILPSELETIAATDLPWQRMMNPNIGVNKEYKRIAELGLRDPEAGKKALLMFMRAKETPAFDAYRSFVQSSMDALTLGMVPLDVPPQTKAGEVAGFVGSVVGQIPLVMGAAGPAKALTGAARVPTALAPVAEGALIGGGLAAGREGATAFTNPDEFDIGTAIKNIATNATEYAAYMGVYSKLNPRVDALVERFPRLEKALETLPGEVAKGAVGGSVAGATVGTGKAVIEALMTEGFDLKAMAKSALQEAQGEASEEIVEAIAMGIAMRLLGMKGPLAKGPSRTDAPTAPPPAQAAASVPGKAQEAELKVGDRVMVPTWKGGPADLEATVTDASDPNNVKVRPVQAVELDKKGNPKLGAEKSELSYSRQFVQPIQPIQTAPAKQETGDVESKVDAEIQKAKFRTREAAQGAVRMAQGIDEPVDTSLPLDPNVKIGSDKHRVGTDNWSVSVHYGDGRVEEKSFSSQAEVEAFRKQVQQNLLALARNNSRRKAREGISGLSPETIQALLAPATTPANAPVEAPQATQEAASPVVPVRTLPQEAKDWVAKLRGQAKVFAQEYVDAIESWDKPGLPPTPQVTLTSGDPLAIANKIRKWVPQATEVANEDASLYKEGDKARIATDANEVGPTAIRPIVVTVQKVGPRLLTVVTEDGKTAQIPYAQARPVNDTSTPEATAIVEGKAVQAETMVEQEVKRLTDIVMQFKYNLRQPEPGSKLYDLAVDTLGKDLADEIAQTDSTQRFEKFPDETLRELVRESVQRKMIAGVAQDRRAVADKAKGNAAVQPAPAAQEPAKTPDRVAILRKFNPAMNESAAAVVAKAMENLSDADFATFAETGKAPQTTPPQATTEPVVAKPVQQVAPAKQTTPAPVVEPTTPTPKGVKRDEIQKEYTRLGGQMLDGFEPMDYKLWHQVETELTAERAAAKTAPTPNPTPRTTATPVTIGMKVRALDRGNVGTVSFVDTKTGEVKVSFRNKKDGTTASRTFSSATLLRTTSGGSLEVPSATTPTEPPAGWKREKNGTAITMSKGDAEAFVAKLQAAGKTAVMVQSPKNPRTWQVYSEPAKAEGKKNDSIKAELRSKVEGVEGRGIIDNRLSIVAPGTPGQSRRAPVGVDVPATNPAVEARLVAAGEKMKPETLKVRMKRNWDVFWARATRDLEFLPRGARYAELSNRLRQLKKGEGIASDEAAILLQGITVEMNADEAKLFRRAVAYRNMLENVETAGDNLAPDTEMQFGFTPAELRKEWARVEEAMKRSPSVSRAFSDRQLVWKEINDAYAKEYQKLHGKLPPFDRKYYFRQEVIARMTEESMKAQAGGGEVNAKKNRSWLKKRGDTFMDFSNRYLEVEHKVLTEMIYDTQKNGILNFVNESENIHAELKRQAKAANNKAIMPHFQAMADAENRDPHRSPNSKDKTAMDLYRGILHKKQAMAIAKLQKLAASGGLPTDGTGRYDDLIEAMVEVHQENRAIKADNPEWTSADLATLDDKMMRKLMSYMTYLMNETEGTPASGAAATFFKGVREKEAYLKETLGSEYQPWETVGGVIPKSLIPEGYGTYQPDPGEFFYQTWSIADKYVQEAMDKALETVGVSVDRLRRVKASGGQKEAWVLPNEIIDTLKTLNKRTEKSGVSLYQAKGMRLWKKHQLLFPTRAFKYNLRNLSGDVDATISGNWRAFRKVPEAASDLWSLMFRGSAPSDKLSRWIHRGGALDILQVQDNVFEMEGLKRFQNLIEKKGLLERVKEGEVSALITAPLKEVARLYKTFFVEGTAFREYLLRYANFLEFSDQLDRGAGKPISYGASLKSEIDAIENFDDKAYKMANDLLGAYDEVSVLGQEVSESWIPFFRFTSVNHTRYTRIIRNAVEDGEGTSTKGRIIAAKLAGLTIKSPIIAYNIGRTFILMSLFTSAVAAFNNLFFPEEEDDLPDSVGGRAHVILGIPGVPGSARDKDGKVRAFTRVGSLTEWLEWFGVLDFPEHAKRFLNGTMTAKELVTSMAMSPVNKVYQSLGPYKAVFEGVTGKTTYPDLTKPRTIRDRYEFVADSLAVGDIYRHLAGKPTRGLGSAAENLLYYKYDPQEVAYNEVIGLKYKWLAKTYGGGGGIEPTGKMNALYYLKQAIRYGDKEAMEKYMDEYRAWGGTRLGIETSVDAMHPLKGNLTKKQEKEFKASLTAKELETLERAEQFWTDVLKSEDYKDLPAYKDMPRGKR